MGFSYEGFVRTPIGKQLAGALGLPRPARLRRHREGDPLIPGAVLVAGHGDTPAGEQVRAVLDGAGVQVASRPSTSVAGVVVDLTGVERPEDLQTLRETVGPALKTLAPTGRVVVIGAEPGQAHSVPQAAARRAVEGVVRSIGKEMRGGGTANTMLLADGAEGLEAPLRFLLSGRSAYVSGQVVRVGPPVADIAAPTDWDRPLDGKVAVVTGAARGIGKAIAATLHRDGATVVCVDMPAAGGPLAEVANTLGGTALQLDVTAADAGARIAEHAGSRHGGLDIVVHNAGITRDKLLANTDAERWSQVVDVNLGSILRMNEALVPALREGGHLVHVSSIAGLAGNRGQTNYAASKAGVVGMTAALAADEAVTGKGVTVNAVAPGFIETEMTAKVPFATREVGRLLNSLSQGGRPVDVAETIGWLAWDANRGVTGQTIRVCGQMMMGA